MALREFWRLDEFLARWHKENPSLDVDSIKDRLVMEIRIIYDKNISFDDTLLPREVLSTILAILHEPLPSFLSPDLSDPTNRFLSQLAAEKHQTSQFTHDQLLALVHEPLTRDLFFELLKHDPRHEPFPFTDDQLKELKFLHGLSIEEGVVPDDLVEKPATKLVDRMQRSTPFRRFLANFIGLLPSEKAKDPIMVYAELEKNRDMVAEADTEGYIKKINPENIITYDTNSEKQFKSKKTIKKVIKRLLDLRDKSPT